MKPMSAKSDVPIAFHFTHLVRGPVLDRRQLLGKRSRTRSVAAGGHLHVQSLMGPHMIVAMAPLVKSALHVLKVGKHSLGQHFKFQTAMKAFVLALRLRMVRTAMADANTEMQQPNRQRREPM